MSYLVAHLILETNGETGAAFPLSGSSWLQSSSLNGGALVRSGCPFPRQGRFHPPGPGILLKKTLLEEKKGACLSLFSLHRTPARLLGSGGGFYSAGFVAY